MKVSETTTINLQNYLRLSEVSTEDTSFLATILSIAKSYISNYTGIPISTDDSTIKTLDDYEDFVILVYILCEDMYDNRTLYIDNLNLNKVAETILNMHCRNLL